MKINEKLDEKSMNILEGRIINLQPNMLRYVLNQANNGGYLYELLKLMKLEHILFDVNEKKTVNMNKVYILGATKLALNDMSNIFKSYNISNKRICYYDYVKVKNLDAQILKNSNTICAIIVGPVPHSTNNIDGSSSLLAYLKKHEVEDKQFPKVYQLIAKEELLINKTNLSACLKELINEGIIIPDLK